MIQQYKPNYTKEDKDALKALIDTDTWFSEFSQTDKFAEELAKATENKHAVIVNNGTVAISIALSALGIRPYDQVIVPDITMVATANAVRFVGATPVFCDIDPSTGLLDAKKAIALSESIGARAIIYVTLNGRINEADVIFLNNYCKENYIHFIKDDAQSLGSGARSNKSLQNPEFGDIHTLSFSPHKSVSCGQGGAIVTSDDKLFEKFKRFKDFGRLIGGADIHDHFGINSKFTELQATLGLSQLNRLTNTCQTKKMIYDYYFNLFKNSKVRMIDRLLNETPWFMEIHVENRDRLHEELKKRNIGSRKMYPALHTQACYDLRENVQEGFKPENSVAYSEHSLWLPSSIDLEFKDIEFIANNVLEICA